MQGKEVKAVLFDLDGVLVDSIDAWYHVFNDTLKHFGFKPLTKKEFVKDFGAPIEYDVRTYFKGKTIEEVKHIYNIKYKEMVKSVKLFPQSIAVLEKLKQQKIKLGLITNSTRLITLTILKYFKLNEYFNAIVTMENVKRRKPAPDMVLKACRMLKVSPKNTILVGDTKKDMLAGKRAGCVTIGYKVKGNFKISKLSSITRFLN